MMMIIWAATMSVDWVGPSGEENLLANEKEPSVEDSYYSA